MCLRVSIHSFVVFLKSKRNPLVHLAQNTRLPNIRHIDEDIVRRMTVEGCPESLLIKVMTDESNASSKNEQSVQGTDLDVLIGFFAGESTAITEQVDEADGDASIDVQDELKRRGIEVSEEPRGVNKESETYSILLGSGDLLNSQSVVEESVTGEVLGDVLLDELDTQIGVVDALDLVANTRDYGGRLYQISCSQTGMGFHSLSLFCFLAWSTNSRGVNPVSRAAENMAAASSRAPPNRLPMVNRPDANEETKSLPARVATIVFMAPETAGPWSAVSMRTISMNLVAQIGSPIRRYQQKKECGKIYENLRRLNQRRETTPPRPISSLKTSEMRIPAYSSS